MTSCTQTMMNNNCIHGKCSKWYELCTLCDALPPYALSKNNVAVAEKYRQYQILLDSQCLHEE